MTSLLNELNSKGWAEIEEVDSMSNLIDTAQNIGKIVPHPGGALIFTIVPKTGKNSIVGTFSNIYGFGEFPLHTDTAFWPSPIRYILLSSSAISSCYTTIASATSILDQLSKTDRTVAEKAIFKVQTINSQFYTSLIFREKDTWGIKYDATCMKPFNDSAKSFVEIIKEMNIDTKKFHWTGHNALIIDNWKALHGRGAALPTEHRELKRIYIN